MWIGGDGIFNRDSIFNLEEAYIAIEQVEGITRDGIVNSKLFDNRGKIRVKTIKDGVGILNSIASFSNYGEIDISYMADGAGLQNSGAFANYGEIEISFIEDGNGLENYDTFYNAPTARLTISEIGQDIIQRAGLWNFDLINNEGEIIIMDIDDGDGLINYLESTLINASTGIIHLFNIFGNTLDIRITSVLDNQGELEADSN